MLFKDFKILKESTWKQILYQRQTMLTSSCFAYICFQKKLIILFISKFCSIAQILDGAVSVNVFVVFHSYPCIFGDKNAPSSMLQKSERIYKFSLATLLMSNRRTNKKVLVETPFILLGIFIL